MIIPMVEITRLEENHDFGTFGTVRIQKQVFCTSLEPRDEENAQDISSIPAQQYECHWHQSSRFGSTYRVLDVPGRTNVLFHAGNRAKDTRGCIILGQYPDKLRGGDKDRGVWNSGATFKEFMFRMRDFDRFLLTIVEHY